MSTLKPVIYQLVVRCFGNTNVTNARNAPKDVNGCGTFGDINDAALAALRAMGVTHIWLTGVLRQATLTDYPELGLPADDPDVVKGIAGSFYAVRDYFDVCPDYAREPKNRLAEFDALVERIHAHGMKALIDLVPNHVARGYASVVKPELSFGHKDDTSVFFHPQNHFFYLVSPPGQKLKLSKPQHWDAPGMPCDGAFEPEDGAPGHTPKATGNNAATSTPSMFDWYETVKLNYGFDFTTGHAQYSPRPRTWDLIDQILAYWQARGVDGFRCDFAHYVPQEAWAYLVGRAKQRNANAYFLAEAYPWAGSGDPITDMQQLVDAGFDAVYHDDSYNKLKRIYQNTGGQDDYSGAMVALSPDRRKHSVEYIENHDERRVASPVVYHVGWGESGFGDMGAGYLLAPLQYLYGPGPVLFYNGQETGEPGAGFEGYGGEDGRTTVFDYWTMPTFAKWVNGHRYDGAKLSDDQKRLRSFYGALLHLCQDRSIRGIGYWGLKYHNRPENFRDCPGDLYSFARFEDHAGRVAIVVANFNRRDRITGRIRIPEGLAAQTSLPASAHVTLMLDRAGAQDRGIGVHSRQRLIEDGFEVALAPESASVYIIEA